MANDLGIDVDTFAKKSKLFELLDAPGRQRMMDAAEQASFKPGEVIMREDEPGAAMYVIQTGWVQVSVEALEGEKTVARLGPGAVFGEIAVVMDQARQATVIAEDVVEAWSFAQAPIDALLKDYPMIRELLARLSLKRSELTIEKIRLELL